MAHNLILSAGLQLFQPCPGAVCGALHPLAWGAHPAEVPSGAHVPLCPQGAPGRVSARCQWLFPAGTMSRQAGACPAQGRGGVPAATMQQPLRKSRHMDALGCPFLLLLSPTALLMRARVGGAALRGSCSSSPALPCKGVPVGMGGHSQPPVEGLSAGAVPASPPPLGSHVMPRVKLGRFANKRRGHGDFFTKAVFPGDLFPGLEC